MDGPALECEVCGGTDFCKESGYFYCNECQTQSQQIQEHVFERVEHKNATTKKIHKKKEDKRDIQLTSWECYNIVLKGLTGELLALGADPQLKIVVRLLWMKYLHKCEVFNLKSNRMPKVSALGSKKDIAILYNRKKRKRSSSRASSATSSVITTRFRSAKKKALVQSHCDQQLSQSQSLTQDSLLANSLASLKSESETPENVKIQYNKLSTKELNRLMSKKHINEHQRDIDDRKLIIKKYHLPTALREDGRCDSETYLKYLKNQGFKYSGSKRSIHKEVRDYLQVLENVLEAEDDEGGDDVKFEPSLTPFVTYTTQLLNSELLTHSLDANFLHDSLDFLLRPCKYLEFLGTHKVRHGGANEDIVIQDPMYLHNATVYLASKSKQPVCVRIVDNMKEDKNVKEFLDSQKKATLTNTDLTVVLSNWQNSQQKQFARNKVLLQKASANVEIPSNAKPSQKYVEHFNPFERYWMNVPINTATYYLSKQDMNEIFDKFPNSFKLLLKEGCRIIEQDINDLFMEFSLSEIYIVYCTDFSSSKKNGSKKPLIEFKDFVRTCKSVW